ncbi:hypothetical protein BDZ89DRAFT_1130956 [Hymenopellis radicata]|nr:hypothetical protein BDZ89DRAFT_1130956 [Hymenopellis radicata]
MAIVPLCPKCHYASPRLNFLIPDEQTSRDRAYTPPSAMQIDHVASTVSTIGDHISFLDKEITRFQTTLAAMKLLRRRLKRDAAQWGVYLSPSGIRRLPVEVLEIIFELACDSYEPAAFKTPLSISWTCFKWRQIALFRPKLWTHIYASPSVKRSLVDLYIRRSGTAPLSVKIENVSSSPYYRQREIVAHPDHPQISALYEVSDRWLEADIMMDDEAWEILQMICDEGKLLLPTLRMLSFGVDGNINPDVIGAPFDIFITATDVLEHLRLGDGGANDDVDPFEWGKIVNVTTNFTTPGMVMLDMSSDSLIAVDDVLGEGEAEFRHVTVNGQVSGIADGMLVTSLKIAPRMSGWSRTLLEDVARLRLPKLQSLSLVFYQAPLVPSPSHEGQLASPLQTFIMASHCTLTHLYILVMRIDVAYTISSPEMLALLALTPQLIHLSIVEHAPTLLTDELLNVLSSRKYCPKMEALELVWAFENPAFTESWLLQMIEHRLAPYGSLRLLVLGTRNGGNVSKGIRDFMKRIRSGPVRAHLW